VRRKDRREERFRPMIGVLLTDETITPPAAEADHRRGDK